MEVGWASGARRPSGAVESLFFCVFHGDGSTWMGLEVHGSVLETTLGERQRPPLVICIMKSLMMGCVPWPPGVVGLGCLLSWSLWRRRADLEGATGCYPKALLALWVVSAATGLCTGMECVSWVTAQAWEKCPDLGLSPAIVC